MDTGLTQHQVLPELRSRVASLDGLRALSITMVLFNHATISCDFPSGTPLWFALIFHGQLGVRIFFVISGFIITLLILREENNGGGFSIKNFYLRRILRIFPVYYLFLFCVIIVSRFFELYLNPGEITAALTFTTGWWTNGTWVLGHTWSLSVEEHFYLMWPVVLHFVTTPKKRMIVAISIVAIYPLLRILIYMTPLFGQRGYIFIGTGDSILYGCILAMMLFYYGASVRKYFTSYVIILRIVLLFFIGVSTYVQWQAALGVITVPFSITIESISVMWLVGSFIFNADFGFRILNSRILIFIGTISYSWYIWQQLFIFKCGRYFSETWFRFPINVALSFVAACLSYYLVEKTFERLRKKVLQ